jgi:hypothetical protein
MEQNVDNIDADDSDRKTGQTLLEAQIPGRRRQEKALTGSEIGTPALSKRKIKRDKIIETITRLIDFF